jgi:hypothetical protein
MLAFLIHRMATRLDPEVNCEGWLDQFSLDSYAPMSRLLDERDYVFLKKQPGYYPALAKRLRRERKKAFVGYLGLLIRDFNQLLRIGRLMQVGSRVDRPEFARALTRQQIRFYFAVCVVRCRVELAPFGLEVEGRKLVDSLGSVFQQVRETAMLQHGA